MVLCLLQNQQMELTHNPTNRKRKRKHSAPARRPEFLSFADEEGDDSPDASANFSSSRRESFESGHSGNNLDDSGPKIIKLSAEDDDVEVTRIPSFAAHASPTPEPSKLHLLLRHHNLPQIRQKIEKIA